MAESTPPRQRRDLMLQPQSDEELTRAAAITPNDVLKARQVWVRTARPPFTTLLDAHARPDE
jgi:hypothetical protein